jgi:hypothetical protein
VKTDKKEVVVVPERDLSVLGRRLVITFFFIIMIKKEESEGGLSRKNFGFNKK